MFFEWKKVKLDQAKNWLIKPLTQFLVDSTKKKDVSFPLYRFIVWLKLISGRFLVRLLADDSPFLPHLVPVIWTGSIETSDSLTRLSSEKRCEIPEKPEKQERLHEKLVGEAMNKPTKQRAWQSVSSIWDKVRGPAKPRHWAAPSCKTALSLRLAVRLQTITPIWLLDRHNQLSTYTQKKSFFDSKQISLNQTNFFESNKFVHCNTVKEKFLWFEGISWLFFFLWMKEMNVCTVA